MQCPLLSTRFRRWHQLRAGQIRLRDFICYQQVTRRVAVEQMMPARQPEIARTHHLPLSIPRLGIVLLTAGVYTSGEFRASGAGYTKRLLAIVISTPDPARRLLICSCEGTMPLDADAVGRGCHLDTTSATHLCGARLDRFKTIAAEDRPSHGRVYPTGHAVQRCRCRDRPQEPITIRQYSQIRRLVERGEACRAKMAALLAAAAEPVPPTPLVELQSGGVILICGRDETAVEAANLLKDHLDVTVLVEPPASIAPAGRS